MLPFLPNQSTLLTCIVQPREGSYIKSYYAETFYRGLKKLVLWFGGARIHFHASPMLLQSPASPSEPLSSIFLRSGLKHYCGSGALRLLGSNHWQGSQQTTFDVCSLPRRRTPDLIHSRPGGQPVLLCRTCTGRKHRLLLPSSAGPTFISCAAFHPLLCSPPLSVWLHTAADTCRGSVAEVAF